MTKNTSQKQSQKLNPLLKLKDAFEARVDFYSNRSSCIFPIYFKDTKNDLHIVFLNYWTIKNNIPKENLVVNFRIYNSEGSLVKRHTVFELSYHNQFSIRDILSELNQSFFEGMVEVEIISTQNLRFSFPGIVGIYQADDLFSVVHSAGRIKNSDEVQTISYTHETNWNCKFSEEITPFFHYFNGHSRPTEANLKVCLRSQTGNIIEEKMIGIEEMNPFSSNFFFADELFTKNKLKEGNFISVLVEHGATFPRLVVGNYFKKLFHMEVTHSFPIIEKKDYCPSEKKDQIPSIINCYTSPELSLAINVFPTNCEGSFKGLFFNQKFNQKILSPKNVVRDFSTNLFSNPVKEKLDDDERFLAIQLHGEIIPSRLNTSFIYKVKGSDSKFSTDIASGAKPCVTPPKHRHWGHGFVENGYDTSILIRNNSHNPATTKSGNGLLTIYSSNKKFEMKFQINAESSTSISLLENFKDLETSQEKKPNFLSFILEMDIPTCETFWISYRIDDGAIFGEHGN
jgi:hypothetical protein